MKDSAQVTPGMLALATITGVLFSVGLSVAAVRWVAPAQSALQVVVFDIVKFQNAQRRVASVFLSSSSGSAEQGEASLTLRNVPARVRQEIDSEANGAVVLVKQGVVSTGYADITDAVLKRLGLPTDVPTQNPVSAALDVAPTQWVNPPAPGKAPIPGAREASKLVP